MSSLQLRDLEKKISKSFFVAYVNTYETFTYVHIWNSIILIQGSCTDAYIWNSNFIYTHMHNCLYCICPHMKFVYDHVCNSWRILVSYICIYSTKKYHRCAFIPLIWWSDDVSYVLTYTTKKTSRDFKLPPSFCHQKWPSQTPISNLTLEKRLTPTLTSECRIDHAPNVYP